MDQVLISAHTEIPMSGGGPSGYVRFVNISRRSNGVVVMRIRNTDGSFAGIDMTQDEWAVFKQSIQENG